MERRERERRVKDRDAAGSNNVVLILFLPLSFFPSLSLFFSFFVRVSRSLFCCLVSCVNTIVEIDTHTFGTHTQFLFAFSGSYRLANFNPRVSVGTANVTDVRRA